VHAIPENRLGGISDRERALQVVDPKGKISSVYEDDALMSHREEARRWLFAHWKQVANVALALTVRKTLTRTEVEDLMVAGAG
jgi:hypothetical protein